MLEFLLAVRTETADVVVLLGDVARPALVVGFATMARRSAMVIAGVHQGDVETHCWCLTYLALAVCDALE